MFQTVLVVRPERAGLLDMTDAVAAALVPARITTGLCHLFVQHTSASLLVQENWDPDVRRDLEDWFARLAPEGDPRYRHTVEGPDDMPAHLRAAVTATSLTLPITACRLALGRWQALYLFEHRSRPPERRIVLTAHGTG
jgi:secondary thiamine-phosphate synthase enzyme